MGVLYAKVGGAWQPIGGGSSAVVLTPNRVVFTANGTWTKPAGLVYAEIEVQGGGGAGGGANATAAGQMSFGGGGAGGGYGRSILDASVLGATETVTVGAGGTAVSGAAGNDGGTSSFGAHVSATGGTGGGVRPAQTAHANYTSAGAVIGGNSTNAQWAIPGSPGEFGDVNPASGLACHGGAGGDSALGAAGQMRALTGTGVNGRGFGGGGSGGSNNASQAANVGGNGAPGVVIVTEYVQTAATTGITEAAADTRYVNVDGDTMTNSLSIERTSGVNLVLRRTTGTAAAAEDPHLAAYTSLPANTRIGYLAFYGSGHSSPGIRLSTDGTAPLRLACGTGDQLVVNNASIDTDVALNVIGVPSATVVGSQMGANGRFNSSVNIAGHQNMVMTRFGAGIATGQHFVAFGATSTIGSISQASGTSIAFNTTSDRRLKNEVGPILDPLARLTALRPLAFTWKSDGSSDEGFFADEVESVVPTAVFGEPDAMTTDEEGNEVIDPQQLNVSGLVPLLVAAVQELSAEVSALKAELAAR